MSADQKILYFVVLRNICQTISKYQKKTWCLDINYDWQHYTSRCWSLLIFWRDWDSISISCKSSLFVFAPRSKWHLPPSQTHTGDRHGSSNRAKPELKISSYILKGGNVARTWLSLLPKKCLAGSCNTVTDQQTNKHATHIYETWPFNLVFPSCLSVYLCSG